jgi:hypothetical protein
MKPLRLLSADRRESEPTGVVLLVGTAFLRSGERPQECGPYQQGAVMVYHEPYAP